MLRELERSFDHFLVTTKKGYDETNWIIVIIVGAGIITNLFGIGGAAAAIVAFFYFYFCGRLSMIREKRLAKLKREREREKKLKQS
jgi:hypothetical protein